MLYGSGQRDTLYQGFAPWTGPTVIELAAGRVCHFRAIGDLGRTHCQPMGFRSTATSF